MSKPDKPLTLADAQPSADASRHSAAMVLVMWLSTYLISLLVAMEILIQTTDLSIFNRVSWVKLGIGLSFVHPGGWLAIAGLVTTLVKRNLRWLIMSAIGGALTGLSVPILRAVGAAVA